MKKEEKILTYEQAKELKWFCRNVVGTREEFYKTLEIANAFDARLTRLEKTCELIEKFLGEKIEPFKSPFRDEAGITNQAEEGVR